MVSGTRGTTTLSLIYLAPIQHTIHTYYTYIHICHRVVCLAHLFYVALRPCGHSRGPGGGGGGRDKAQDMEMKMEKFAC